jgi:hypothetical protein
MRGRCTDIRYRLIASQMVALLSAAVFGCGGSDPEQIASVFQERLATAVDRDAERFCGLTSPEHRRELTELPSTDAAQCARRIERGWTADAVTPRQRAAVARVHVVDVVVHGDHASASLELDGCEAWGSEFRKDDSGQWRYDGPSHTVRVPSCAADRSK